MLKTVLSIWETNNYIFSWNGNSDKMLHPVDSLSWKRASYELFSFPNDFEEPKLFTTLL